MSESEQRLVALVGPRHGRGHLAVRSGHRRLHHRHLHVIARANTDLPGRRRPEPLLPLEAVVSLGRHGHAVHVVVGLLRRHVGKRLLVRGDHQRRVLLVHGAEAGHGGRRRQRGLRRVGVALGGEGLLELLLPLLELLVLDGLLRLGRLWVGAERGRLWVGAERGGLRIGAERGRGRGGRHHGRLVHLLHRAVAEVGVRGGRSEVEDLLLVVDEVLVVATGDSVGEERHLLETVGGGGLGGRVVVHSPVDARPGAFLLDDVLAAAVRGDLAEEAVEVDLALAEHGLLEGALVVVLDEHLEAVHELGLLAHVVGRVDGDVDRVVGDDVLRGGAVVELGVPDVHRALEVGKHRLVERATSHAQGERTWAPRASSCTYSR